MSGWTALVLAGSRPGRDAFAEEYGAKFKALIPVCGTPMVTRVTQALLGSGSVERIRVLTQDPVAIADVLPQESRVMLGVSQGSIAQTLEHVMADPETRFPLLVTTADHALLSPEMVEDFIAKAQGADMAIGLVEKAPLMKRLPETKRTWLKFRGGAYSGANLFAFATPEAMKAVELWRGVEQDRKKGWRMIAALGPALLMGSLLRLRTLQQTLDKVGGKLGLNIRAVEMGDPLAAVDVDKSEDHVLVTAILEGRT